MAHLLFAPHLFGPGGLCRRGLGFGCIGRFGRTGCRRRRSSLRDEVRYAILDRFRTGCDALADSTGTALGHIGEASTSSTNTTATRCGGTGLVGGLRTAGH